MKTCKELVKKENENLAKDVKLQRYWDLLPNGRELIKQWFDRGWERRDCPPKQSFEPFIYTWFAFNGWASCVTGRDSDTEWRDALSLTPRLYDDFSCFASSRNPEGLELAQKFYQCWPIFDAKDIKKNNAHFYEERASREEAIKHYFDKGVKKYQPACLKRHTNGKGAVPLDLDWPHTLSALYQLRCNLFHGEKGTDSEMDQKLVHSGFQLLVHFLKYAEYLEKWVGDIL